MKINGMNYLLLERRGCEYSEQDANKDNVGNHRVGMYDNMHRVPGKDGNEYIIEFTASDFYRYRDTNKRTGEKLKKSVRELVQRNHMWIDTEFEKEDGCFRNCALESEQNAKMREYSIENILEAVNEISAEHYDAVLWVDSFDAILPADQNFTPATLINEWAKKNHLEQGKTHFFTPYVKLYTGNYKYLCYSIKENGNGNKTVRVYLERMEQEQDAEKAA